MKILVTGNLGYVGPVVVEQLRRSYPDADLSGLDMAYFAPGLTGAVILPESRLNVQHFADVRALPAHALRGVEAVVHLAAISNDPMGHRFEKVTLDINQRATLDVAAQAKALGVSSFVFASSCSVYGAADDSARTEDSPVAPLTAYARSKVLAEEGLAELAGPGFRVTCLRFATACGWSDRLRLDLVLNDFAAAAVAEKMIRIQSDGTPWRPLIHVRDMARAIDWAVGRDASAGDFVVTNVGTDDWNYQVRDLAAAVAKVIPGVDVWVNPDAVPDRRSYRVSFERFRQLAPGHQPAWDLMSTVTELADGLGRLGFADTGFRTSTLVRLNALAALRASGMLDEELRWTPRRDGG